MYRAQMEVAEEFGGAHRALLGADRGSERCEATCMATAGVMIAVACIAMILVSLFCKFWLWKRLYDRFPWFQQFEARVINGNDRLSAFIKLMFVPPDRLPSPPPLLRLTTTQREAREISNFLAIPDEECPGDESCAVCLDDLEKDCVRLPCSHVFHLKCMKKWVLSKDTCPLCNASVRAGVLAQLQSRYQLPVICVPVLVQPAPAALQAAADAEVPEAPTPAASESSPIIHQMPVAPVIQPTASPPVVQAPPQVSPLLTPQPLSSTPATLSSDSLPVEAAQQVRAVANFLVSLGTRDFLSSPVPQMVAVEQEYPMLLRRLQMVQQHAYTLAYQQIQQVIHSGQAGPGHQSIGTAYPVQPSAVAAASDSAASPEARQHEEAAPNAESSGEVLADQFAEDSDEPVDMTLYISQEPERTAVPVIHAGDEEEPASLEGRTVSRFSTLSIVPPQRGSSIPTLLEASFVCSPIGSARHSSREGTPATARERTPTPARTRQSETPGPEMVDTLDVAETDIEAC